MARDPTDPRIPRGRNPMERAPPVIRERMARDPTDPRIPRVAQPMSWPQRLIAADDDEFAGLYLRSRGGEAHPALMSPNERRPRPQDERGLGVRRPALPAERAEQHVELGRVMAG